MGAHRGMRVLTGLMGALLATAAPALAETRSEGEPLFEDVSLDTLPIESLKGLSMDAGVADFDADGDLDILIASEFRPNVLLINDGRGRFTDESADRIPQINRDSEDVAIADFDGDGDLDAVIVSEDDQINEFYLNDGSGSFEDAGDRWPVELISNAVVAGDVDGDGDADLILGNNGQNVLLLNDGSGSFTDVTASQMPALEDVTQDIELGDADGDGDPDLLVGNEGDNRLLINDGAGRFTDESADRIPLRATPEETREADFGDADGDGDLDILFANVRFFNQIGDFANRLLINDGTGRYSDETAARLPTDTDASAEGDFIDLDGDGDLDIVTTSVTAIRSVGNAPYQAYENDGTGRFTLATKRFFPDTATGNGFDVEAADFNGDGLTDLFLANRIGPDVLLVRKSQ